MRNNEITLDKFYNLKRYINAYNINDIIDAHKKLIGKNAKDETTRINDCGIKFIYELLMVDWGRSFVYEYTDAAKDFMNSKYLSNYIKHELKKMLGKMNYYTKSNDFYNEIMKKLLNSNKAFNDMNKNEIKYLYFHLKKCMSNKEITSKVDTRIARCFNLLLYKLNGEGVKSLLKDEECISKSKLANHILLTSGLNDRASYYSGRGVNYSDLSDKHLTEIFIKLSRIDINYAINFMNMVIDMKTLGATEFINSFKELVKNNFNIMDTKLTNNNVSLDDVHGETRDVVAFLSIISSRDKDDEEYQILQSDRMKRAFLIDIKNMMKKSNLKLYKKIENTYICGNR